MFHESLKTRRDYFFKVVNRPSFKVKTIPVLLNRDCISHIHCISRIKNLNFALLNTSLSVVTYFVSVTDCSNYEKERKTTINKFGK
jgi:hypothetical protein